MARLFGWLFSFLPYATYAYPLLMVFKGGIVRKGWGLVCAAFGIGLLSAYYAIMNANHISSDPAAGAYVYIFGMLLLAAGVLLYRPSAAPPSAAGRSGDLVFCPHCGARNEPNAQFCGDCGRPIDTTSDAPAASGTLYVPYQTAGTGSGWWSRPRWVWWAAGLAALTVVVGGAWWVLSSRTVVQGGPTLQGEQVPSEGNTHAPEGSPIAYRAHPPASGTHYPTPAPRGVYPQGLPEGLWVHSLEHGYIVLAYRPPASPDQLPQFQDMVESFPKSKYGYAKLVIIPYRDMDHPYAALAWTWRLWLDRFDREKVLEFYRAHVDRGPEDIP